MKEVDEPSKGSSSLRQGPEDTGEVDTDLDSHESFVVALIAGTKSVFTLALALVFIAGLM